MLRKYRSFANAIKLLLTQEYKFMGGEKIQDMLVHDLLALYTTHLRDGWRLDAGPDRLVGCPRGWETGEGQRTIENTRMVPVTLTIAREEDLRLRLTGYSAKEIRRYRVARMLQEAYQQGGVLNFADVSHLIGVSAGTIGKDVKEHQLEQGVVLPHRGSIHDMGPTLTHKTVIIKQFLQNVPTPEIARRTSHSEEACDRYIKAFKKVRKLFEDGVPPENIASDLEMSLSLVKEYIAIIEENKNSGGGKGASAWTMPG
jgi:hypothetical protein